MYRREGLDDARRSGKIRAMRLLAFDTSTHWLSVACGADDAWVQKGEPAGQAHSERLLPLVDAVLAEAGWSLHSLDGIAFGAGPGSFTGVRIACGVAQGLAFGAGLPLVPVPTLEALAQAAWRAHAATRIVACLDARMREVYVAAYVRDEGHLRELRRPRGAEAGRRRAARRGWRRVVGRRRRLRRLSGTASTADAWPASMRMRCRTRARSASWRNRGLRAGEGVAAADALPLYVRHRVALTSAERARRRASLRRFAAMATLPADSCRAQSVLWRPLVSADVAYVAALEAHIHAAPWTPGQFSRSARSRLQRARRRARGPHRRLWRADAGARRGAAAQLSVVPDARRDGLGRELSLQFLADARRLGAEQVFLEVRESNAPAIALYERAGFESVARRESYYPPASAGAPREDALVMRRGLEQPPDGHARRHPGRTGIDADVAAPRRGCSARPLKVHRRSVQATWRVRARRPAADAASPAPVESTRRAAHASPH